VKILYTATATADDGGRNGRTRTSDGTLDLALTMPESMGGPGGEGTNPEQLFAAGFAGCFANAMRSIARRDRREEVVEGATVTTHVGIGRIPDGRFGLAVRMEVAVPGLDQAEAESLVERADARCPYSNAIRGNVDVDLAVSAGAPA
jgi:osmotically inducible protein OsmC